MNRLTTKDFIAKAKKVHGDKYDYSKVEYKCSKEKVCIICPTHGEFWQKPNDHLSGKGCRKCVRNTPLTTETFVNRAKKVHGGKYDYSKVEYINANTKVCIICPIHGEFWQKPYDHLIKKGCPRCSNKGGTIDEFIRKAKKVHGDKYDYSNVEYVNSQTKVCIICPIHGEFWQIPASHLKGCGCKKCGIEASHNKQKKKEENFLEKARKVHNDKYNYSKVEYVNNKTKVCIVCPIHGEFWQTPSDHLRGKGCKKCGYELVGKRKSITFEEFFKRANKLHNNKYEYSKDTYKNCSNKILMKCPIHGEFWQTPDHHLHGCGCPHCNESHLERDISILLAENNIYFLRTKHFDWLGKQHLDFYLPKYDIGIECQGEQHYIQRDNWGRKDKNAFNHQLFLDKKKLALCNANKVKLLYFSNKKYDENVITQKEELLNKIKSYGL